MPLADTERSVLIVFGISDLYKLYIISEKAESWGTAANMAFHSEIWTVFVQELNRFDQSSKNFDFN